jgi:type IVB pilus formation R64 PilN family outer membrane protein
MNFRKLIGVFSLYAVVLLSASACEQAVTINEEVRERERQIEAALESISPDTQSRRSLQVDRRPWYGNQAVAIQGNKSLPREYSQPNAITMTFAQPVGFNDAVRMVEGVAGIPIMISGSVYQASMGEIALREFLPTGGQEVSGGRLVWSGPLYGILNQIGNFFGAEWSYEGGTIKFTTETTKTFMLNALSGEITLSGNSSSTGDGGSSSSNVPEIEIDNTATLEIWNEISETVSSIIGTQGQASFSPSTGSITVTGRPDVLRRVETYLRHQNQKRLRRIAVSVQVLSVTTEDTQAYSLDIDGVIKGALGESLSLTGGTNDDNGLSVSILKSPTASQGDVSAALEASEGIQRAAIIHSGSLVTLSDQPAPLQVARQIAYLARASSSGTDSVSLEPGVIDVGLFMTVLPRIVEDDRILMRLSLAITDADPNFRRLGTDDIEIELPELETTGFLQNAVVSNGETMVLAGFERRANSLNTDTNPFSYLLGASHNTTQGREILVLVINSRILPEQPITVIGQ